MIKKIFSAIAAALLILGCATAAFAANPKITAQTGDLDYTADIGERGPGYELWIPLDKTKFDDDTLTEDITTGDVRTSKIAVRSTVKSGKDAIGSVEIKGDKNKLANIVVTLADPFKGTKPLDFSVVFYLTIDGQRQSNYEMEVYGTIANQEIEIFSDTVYVDLNGGQVAVASENAKQVEFDLGNGVSVFADAAKGKRYTGSSTMSPTDRDDKIFGEYPDIEAVYHLGSSGFGSGAKVKLDTQGEVYFVYDGSLKSLGKTSDMLAYSDTYYISSKMFDVQTDEPELEPMPEPEPDDGGDANGGTHIPDTGVSPMLTVAVSAGAVALVAALLLGRKRS